MPTIETKLGIEYRKVNGVLVKFYPQTTAEQVLFDSTTYSGVATVKAALEDLNSRVSEVTALDALVFKGTVDSTHPLPVSGYAIGDVYRVGSAGTYAGQACEVGDILTCVAVSTPAHNSDWIVTQSNIDGAVVGPASAVNERIAVFNGTTGKLIKDGGKTVAELQAEIDSDVAAHADDGATGSVLAHVTLSDTPSSSYTASNSHVAATPYSVYQAKSAAESAQDAIDTHDDVTATATTLGHVTLSDSVISTSAASDGVAASPAAVKAAKDAADAAQADADALDTRMDTAEDDIDSLEGRMDTAEGTLSTLTDQLDDIEEVLDDLGVHRWALYGSAGSAASADISNLADGGAYIEGLVDA